MICTTCIHSIIDKEDDYRHTVCGRYAPRPESLSFDDEEDENRLFPNWVEASSESCGDGRWFFDGKVSSKEEILNKMMSDPDKYAIHVCDCTNHIESVFTIAKRLFNEGPESSPCEQCIEHSCYDQFKD
jgi:hypothetical protein